MRKLESILAWMLFEQWGNLLTATLFIVFFIVSGGILHHCFGG